MKSTWLLACAVAAALPCSLPAHAEDRHDRHAFDKLIAAHAKANLVPEALVHRVIVRESKYNPDLVGRGGTIGLMQLKLATARGVGYRGGADGLRDPETNLTYGIKYLAGAWRAAEGNHDRAMRYFAIGYYYVAKQQRLERLKQAAAAPPSMPPKPFAAAAKSDETTQENAGNTDAEPAAAATKPRTASHKTASRKPRESKAEVPPPPAPLTSGANDAKPR
jgi:soluble lytic murein transglycosylase-like protein